MHEGEQVFIYLERNPEPITSSECCKSAAKHIYGTQGVERASTGMNVQWDAVPLAGIGGNGRWWWVGEGCGKAELGGREADQAHEPLLPNLLTPLASWAA